MTRRSVEAGMHRASKAGGLEDKTGDDNPPICRLVYLSAIE